MDPAVSIAAIATGYLLGAISFARIVVRVRTGDEVAPIELVTPDGIGRLNPRSVSATSVRLQLGPRWGILVAVLDMLKAFLPTLAFRLVFPGEPYFLLCAAAAPFGHNWPVYHRFRGGNGQSPILGGLLAIDWLGAVVTNVAGVLFGRAAFKDGFLGQIVAIPLIVPWLWWRSGGDPWYIGYALAVNGAWWAAFWPTFTQYLALRRTGHLPSDDDVLEMFQMDYEFTRRGSAHGAATERAALLRSRVGGKAAGLLVARKAGLPVPPFSVVSVEDAAALSGDGPNTSEARARLDTAVVRLGHGPFAVRSSAQAEDAERSFAGQLLTRLNVSESDVASAVAEVALSATASGMGRYEEAVGAQAGLVGVVVQEMVDADFAGAAFSRDPLTFQPEVVVEGVEGLGDKLVSGERTPARGRFDRETFELAEREERDSVPSWVLEEAARLAVHCEEVFGEPQDIEWAHDGRQMWLLQSRRLTGFENAEVFADTFSSEVWPGLIKPLVFDVGDTAVNAAWGRILVSLAGPMDIDWRRMAALTASRVYFNETLMGGVLARAGLPENVLEGLARGEKPRMRIGSWSRLLPSLARVARFLGRSLRWRSHVRRELPRLQARVAAEAAEMDRVKGAAIAERLPALLALLEDAAYLSALTTISMNVQGLVTRAVLKVLTRDTDAVRSAGAVSDTAALTALASVAERVSVLADEERAVVASGDEAAIGSALCHSEAGRAALASMAELIRQHGHIATVNTDFSTPAWREETGMLWKLAAASSREAAVPNPTPDALAKTRGKVRRALAARRLKVLREYIDARDQVNDTLARVYDVWRTAARAAGETLAPQILPRTDLVYFLTLAELTAALGGSPAAEVDVVASERAEQLARDAEITPPHRLWDLRLPPRRRMSTARMAASQVGRVMQGTPASPGVVQGRARVLPQAADSDDLSRDDILVIGHADVGLTPLFTVVGGVITAVGGSLAHAAVVARELGIPAVVGLHDATMLVPDGSLVRLDGSEGTVTIVSCEPVQ